MERKHRGLLTALLSGTSSLVLITGAHAAALTGQTPANALEEVVVTAQRREERTQDVPVAINTVSAETAAKLGATGTESLTVMAPGLDFSRQAVSGGVPFIRGVGTPSATLGGESPVAIYVDDVYIGTPSANTFSFNNIEQISVLKGPQGTLFGRNATGGVIQVTTRNPSATPTMDASVGYANYQTYTGKFYGSVPLTEQLGANIAVYGHKQDKGWGTDLTTGGPTYTGWDWGVRGKLLWQPSDKTSVLLAADYLKLNTSQGLFDEVLPGYVSTGGGVFVGRYNSVGSPNDFAVQQHYGVSLKVEHEMPWARLVSISAERRTLGGPGSFDLDSSAPVIASTLSKSVVTMKSQELQLQSVGKSRLSWIVGAFYWDANSTYKPLTSNGTTKVFSNEHLKSYAAFVDGSYNLTDATKLALGVRYTEDHYLMNGTLVTPALTSVFPQRTLDIPKITYRAVLDHHFTDDIMAYASYSRGFKSGGFNMATLGSLAAPTPSVQPEILDAVEGGVKSEFLDRRLQVNVSAFHYDYKNLQVTTIVNGLPVVVNAAAAKIKGLDVDLTAVVTEHLRLRAGFALLDGHYSSFPVGPYLLPRHNVGGVETSSCATLTEGPGPRTGGNLTCAANLTGNTTIRTPKFTGTLGFDYTIDSDVGPFVVAATLYRNSGFKWEPDNQISQPAYTLLNSSVAWTTKSGRYSVRVWGMNLLNQYYYSYAAEGGFRFASSAAAPRTFGITLGAHY
jgi:iron complex outermembrane receptor protein